MIATATVNKLAFNKSPRNETQIVEFGVFVIPAAEFQVPYVHCQRKQRKDLALVGNIAGALGVSVDCGLRCRG